MPRVFVLRRDVDVTGISGAGDVAEGVQFDDGVTVVHWRGKHASTVVWPSIDDVLEINCHGGKTRIVWGA
jgi:hypothetical protein